MNAIIEARNALAALSGANPDELLSTIQEWNKSKKWLATPINIQITKDGVMDNAEELGKIVEVIGDYVDDVAKNDLDAEVVADAKKVVGAIGTWLIETRKIQTNPLKEVASHYTKHEAKFKDFAIRLQSAIDAINEKEYKRREQVIREYFAEVIETEGMTDTVSMDTFADFIANKRKTKCLTEKSKLNKATKDAIDKAVLDVVLPIREARELEERKALQSKQFDSYLANIETSGDTEHLNASIITLKRFKEQVPDLYPYIVDEANRRIDNAISLCEANIRANDAEAKRQEEAGKDDELMEEVRQIETKLLETIATEELNNLNQRLREIYPQLHFTENQTAVKEVGERINAIIAEREKPATEEPREKEYNTATKWRIPIGELEVLATRIFEGTEEEAKKAILKAFEAQLDLVDLKEAK